MISAPEARRMVTNPTEYTNYGTIIDFLDKKIRIAAKRGYVSLCFQAPNDTSKQTLEDVRQRLMSEGYGVKVWEEQKQIQISW
jgi:hypothetical protein